MLNKFFNAVLTYRHVKKKRKLLIKNWKLGLTNMQVQIIKKMFMKEQQKREN